MVSEKKIFLGFSHYKSMGAIYGHGGHRDLRTTTICTYFQSPFNTRLHIKFEEIWPRGFRGEVVQRGERTDGRRTESDHNSSSWAFGSGELKMKHIWNRRRTNKELQQRDCLGMVGTKTTK